jgi:molecular chaperone IbpA
MTNNIARFDTQALNRALIGFDRMFDEMEARFVNTAQTNYPPYNVIRESDNLYTIEVAVAGFKKDEIKVTIEDGTLSIEANKDVVEDDEGTFQYLHRGLASRAFTRSWTLAEHIKVKGAEIKDGILTVKLEREVPEELKPKIIDVIEVK